ncbi:hypothetical protein [Sporosarcina aquimarina]|uniref:Uncharacterized protein n=1 Tax=Sporosarcina aquimarina TaxID=114975 RepID=A0ABU4FYP5_9BACL|nr:hypothetical protein [Sporosarcina aquimarina]MDW0109843.1 hypothetical protein [Sporosarcina aquimarina]
MPSKLEQLFSEIHQENKRSIAAIGSFRHPLLQLLKKALEDQDSALNSLSEILPTQSPLPLSAFKKECTHIYHANEVAMPFYESWARAVDWIPDESTQIKQDLGQSMNKMHSKLETVAQILEQTYGHMEVKYVVPTFYLPITN